MKKLAFCLSVFLASKSVYALECVPVPQNGDCVVYDDGSVKLSPVGADRVSVAVEQNGELTRQIAAMTAAYEARTKEAVAWEKAVEALMTENLQWGNRVNDERKRAEEFSKRLELSENSFTHSTSFYVGLSVLSFLGGAIAVYELRK